MGVGRWLLGMTFIFGLLNVSAALAQDNDLTQKIKESFAQGELKGLHSVLIVHGGETLAEVYFPGFDQRQGLDIGRIDHSATSLHDVRSITKSVTGLLYGIALSEGLVPGVDEPLMAQFPAYPDLIADPARKDILVRHALTMTMGLKWDETAPYTSTRNSEIAMAYAPDRQRYALEQPILYPPGTHWTYSGGAASLIGALIVRGAGVPLDVYAKQKLFDPLGITDFEWQKLSNGKTGASSGLRLTTHDLAKIGRLMIDKGVWQGNQIVPAEWIEQSLTPSIMTSLNLRYGFLWWLANDGTPPDWFAGFGNGGQRLTVNPGRDMVVVIYAGNYNKPDAWKTPTKVILDFAVPAIEARQAD